MASKLLSIPAELLASIAGDLDITDYGNLRLSCKQVEELTFPYFAKKFFSRRKFFRGYLSLSTLLTISESRFSPYLETVILSTVLLENDPPSGSDSVFKEAFIQAHAEQTSILASGWDRDMLVAAFENLPNLRGIAAEAFDDCENWDFDAAQFNSDVDGGYGLKTMLRNLRFEQGRPPRQIGATHQWVVTVQTILAAAAKAKVRPKSLCIGGRKADGSYHTTNIIGVDDDAFNIPSFMRPMMLPVIEELEELDLHVHNRYIYPPPDDPACCRTSHLREFLGLPRKLQKLRIHRLLGGDLILDPSDQGDDFWTWIGQDHKGKDKAPAGQQGAHGSGPSASNALVSPAPVGFPHLRELELGAQDIQLEDLMRLLKKVSPTLRKVSLQGIILRDRHVDHSEDFDDVVKTEVELWASFCGKLAALPCEDLYEVNISGLGDVGTWHLRQFGETFTQPDSVYFKVLKISGEDTYTAQADFSYKGPNVRNALRQLADDLRAAMRDGRHVFNAEPAQRRYSF
ncbi:hypothetical protein VSDG_03213 [Cytospora chrysosperma]|uniref:F-box domain-containing protein n=1 Tax=Cytospora chrysosperma TaxID=252740 RepID=A0A423WB64_CYTCH|nr:hypothetical protein VSDG_03213 [Valsa sordida]